MAIVRHDPFHELFRWPEQFLRTFDRDLGEVRSGQDLERSLWTPAVDIFEDTDGITLKVELPEVDAKDVDIQVEGNTLTLRGERNLDMSEKKDQYTRVERWYGSFMRSFTLPTSVDSEHIAAETRDGVLRIHLPKKAETRPRQIKVSIGGALAGKH